jgi:hypothetical protein
MESGTGISTATPATRNYINIEMKLPT